MTHAGGRPRKVRRKEFCRYPQCGERGYTFHVRICKKSNVYLYPRFRHDNRSIPDHNIHTMINKKSMKHVVQIREYHRTRKKVTLMSYLPEHKLVIRLHNNNALSIVIYDFPKINENVQIANFSGICKQCFGSCIHIHDLRCSECNNTTVVYCPTCKTHWNFAGTIHAEEISTDKDLELELRRLKRSCLKLNEVNWILNSMLVKMKRNIRNDARNFYNVLKTKLRDTSRNIIIAFGHAPVRSKDRISNKFNGNITEFYDEYGMLEELLERREHKQNRSKGQFGSEKWDH
jgi:hypothetical protein